MPYEDCYVGFCFDELIIVLVQFSDINSVLELCLWFDLWNDIYICIYNAYVFKCIHCMWLNIVVGHPISLRHMMGDARNM